MNKHFLNHYLSVVASALLVTFAAAAPAHAQFGNLLKDLKELKKSVEPTKQSPDQPAVLAVPPTASGQQPVAAGGTNANTRAPSAQAAAQADTSGVQRIRVAGGKFTVIDTGDAQLALTRIKASSLADAQSNKVTVFKDGDPIWLFLKTKKPLYKYSSNNIDNPDELMKIFFKMGFSLQSGGYGPHYNSIVEIIGHSECVLVLKKSEHQLTELAIQVNPGFRRSIQPENNRGSASLNVSSFQCMEPLFNEVNSGRLSRGIHSYEMFFMDQAYRDVNNDGYTEVVAARTMFTLDISNGFTKFREQNDALDGCYRVSVQKANSLPLCAYR